MENEIYDLIGRLQKDEIDGLDVLKWAAPIASFGDPAISRIATLGLNPSDKEFTDNSGNELNGVNRRFHTLKSLNLKNWGETTPDQVSMIAQQCRDYFSRNPYDNWFKRLDFLISGTSLSYYFPSNEACHLDLVPFATGIKWAMLSTKQKKSLLSQYGDILGKLINASRIKVLVLNGRTVVNTLSQISDVDYRVTEQPTWKLQRTGDNYIAGFSYEGTIHRIGTIQLNNEITILGFNHNIQSSFGGNILCSVPNPFVDYREIKTIIMRPPKNVALVAKLRADLQNFDQNYTPLNGIQNAAEFDCFLLQLEDSIRRIQYVQTIALKAHNASCTNPNLSGFNPLNAAVYYLVNGNIDEAAWLVFLATHFGKDKKNGWGLMRAVYSGLGAHTWDWATVSAAPQLLGHWVAANQIQLKARGNFGNHRKYASLKYSGTGVTIDSYVDWIGPQQSHIFKFAQLEPANATARTRFHAFYRAFSRHVYGFARMGAFDFLTMMGKVGILNIEPDLIYIKGATGPVSGAKLLFANNPHATISNTKLETDLGQLEGLLGVPFGMQVLEDALCNWQKSPNNYIHFTG